jgi:hypothetical protein
VGHMSKRDVRPIQVGLRLLALIVALVIQPSSLSATTIVLVRSRSELFVGADSKRVRDGTQDVRIDTGCKITRDNHGAVAAARVTAESSLGFDVHALAAKALTQSPLLRGRVSAFIEIAKAPIAEVADKLHQRPDTDKLYRDKVFLEVVFAGFENKVSTLIHLWYGYSIGPRGVQVASAERACPPCAGGDARGYTVLTLGENSVVTREVPKGPAWKSNMVPRRIQELLELQAAETPSTVGPPFNILHITKRGSRWVEGGDNCR